MSRGYKNGLFFAVVLALVAFFLGQFVGSLLHPFVSMLLSLLAAVAAVLYSMLGFQQVLVSHFGAQLFLGKRTGKAYPEGWIWNYPAPFGGIVMVDGRKRPIDLKITEILAKDTVKIDVDMALQIKVADPNVYLGSDNPESLLRNTTESDIRVLIAQLNSEGIHQEQGVMINKLLGGSTNTKSDSPLEGCVVKSLKNSVEEWGIEVVAVQITQIRLPEDVEQANADIRIAAARKKKEEAEREAEMVEAEHVVTMINLYKDKAGLDPKTAASIAQSERGKATRVILDGNASPIENAGLLASGALNSLIGKGGGDAPSSQPKPEGEAKPTRRRTNQGKEKK